MTASDSNVEALDLLDNWETPILDVGALCQ